MCDWHALRRTGSKGRLDAARASWIGHAICLGRRDCSFSALAGPVDATTHRESRTQLILSRSLHSSAGDAAHAAGLWDRLGYRYEAALALLDTKDESLLRESLARLTDLGAEAAARLVRRIMRDLGIRSIPAGARTATKAHPRGLTAREQEILELLSEGQSNEEISASLFISVRTVEHHVSAILGKLGASTRQGRSQGGARGSAWRMPTAYRSARNLGSRLVNMGDQLPSDR